MENNENKAVIELESESRELTNPDPVKAIAFIAERKKILMSILDVKTDIQNIQGHDFKKKSYWRKLSAVYGVNLEFGSERKEEHENGAITYFFVMRAIASNGIFSDGSGACTSSENLTFNGDNWVNKNGNISKLKSIHDTRATAETRAKNRAISDLLSFGEISAEEVNNAQGNNNQQQSKPVEVVKENPAVKVKAIAKLRTIAENNWDRLNKDQLDFVDKAEYSTLATINAAIKAIEKQVKGK